MENFFNYSVQTRISLIENNVQLSKTINIPHDKQLEDLEESQACSVNTYLIRKTYEEEYNKYCDINSEFERSFFHNIVNTKNNN